MAQPPIDNMSFESLARFKARKTSLGIGSQTAAVVKSGAGGDSATMAEATNFINGEPIQGTSFKIKNEANISRSRNSRGNGSNYCPGDTTPKSPTFNELRRVSIENKLNNGGEIIQYHDSNGGTRERAKSEAQIERLGLVQSRFARSKETRERSKSMLVWPQNSSVAAYPEEKAAHSNSKHHHAHQPQTPHTIFNLLKFIFAGHDNFEETTCDADRKGSSLIKFTPRCMTEKHAKLSAEIAHKSYFLPMKQNGHVERTRAYFERLSRDERRVNLQVSEGRNFSAEEMTIPTPKGSVNDIQEAVTDHEYAEEIFRSILDAFEFLSALSEYL